MVGRSEALAQLVAATDRLATNADERAEFRATAERALGEGAQHPRTMQDRIGWQTMTSTHHVSASSPSSADARAPRLVSARAALAQLQAAWERNDPPLPTGLRQLDAMLSGGLRPGDVIALGGQAKSGKSALACQVAFDVACAHEPNEPSVPAAVVVYASVEMPAAEVVARWVAREAFRCADEKGVSWAMTYSAILYGQAHRGEGLTSESVQRDVGDRLLKASERVHERTNLYVQHVAPGSTPADLVELVRSARAAYAEAHQGRPVPPAVLVVDPIQRLFAAPGGALVGRVLENANANEVERIGLVAQQLKALADDEHDGCSIIFTSDTTKAAVKESASSATSLRGSYQLNHLATTILGLYTAPEPDGLGDVGKVAVELVRAAGADLVGRRDVTNLGRQYAVLECSGNRRGPATSGALLFVAGAMHFAEAPEGQKGRR